MANVIVKNELIDDIREGKQFVVDATDVQSEFGGKVGSKKFSLKSFFRDAVRRVKAQNPISPNQADIVSWILYDRFIYAAGATIPAKFTFYSVPSGSGGKTNVDTNMTQVKRLEDPQWFNTVGLGFYFNPNILLSDLNGFLNTEYMNFWVGNKTYLTGPVQNFPGAAGVTGFSTKTAESFYVNGQADPMKYYDLRLPAGLAIGNQGTTDGLIGITILQGQAFWIDMLADGGGYTLAASTATPSPGTGLTIMSFLYGVLSRGVQ